MIHSNQSGLSIFEFGYQLVFGQLKGSLIGKEENFVIKCFRLLYWRNLRFRH